MLVLYLWFNCFGSGFFLAFTFPGDVKFHHVVMLLASKLSFCVTYNEYVRKIL